MGHDNDDGDGDHGDNDCQFKSSFVMGFVKIGRIVLYATMMMMMMMVFVVVA